MATNNYPGKRPFTDKFLHAYLADVSADSSAFVAVPAQGQLVGIMCARYGTISGADCNIAVEINGVAVTGATLVLANASSAAGDVDSVFTFAPVAVKQGDVIEFDSGGESSTTCPAMFTAVISEL
jgi:hypothetical protein